MTAFARQSLAETEKSKLHIEQFNESELLVNITEHTLVPQHEILSGASPSAGLRAPCLASRACSSLAWQEPPRAVWRRQSSEAECCGPCRQGEEAAARPVPRAAPPAAAHPDERPSGALLRAQEGPGELRRPKTRSHSATSRLAVLPSVRVLRSPQCALRAGDAHHSHQRDGRQVRHVQVVHLGSQGGLASGRRLMASLALVLSCVASAGAGERHSFAPWQAAAWAPPSWEAGGVTHPRRSSGRLLALAARRSENEEHFAFGNKNRTSIPPP